MRSRSREYAPRPSGGINMTPMIDVTFLLLTFFMLASHFASSEKVSLQLPSPDDSRAVDRRFLDKVMINLVHQGPDLPPRFTLGAMPAGSLAELAAGLQGVARRDPGVQVILRADRRLPYGVVRRVMEIVAAQGLTRLQVAAELSEDG